MKKFNCMSKCLKKYIGGAYISINLRFTFSAVDKEVHENSGKNSCSILRPKRQLTSDPKSHLDSQITYLLSALPYQIDLAEEKIEKKVKFLVFKKLTWGWAVVVGALFEFYSDFVLMNRTMGNFGNIGTWWGYGQIGFYGIGFGFPYIIGLPQDNLPCHSSNFMETLKQYGLINGLNELFASNLPISAIKTLVAEFDSWARIKIACITGSESDYIEAAEVSYLLDELIAALNLRIAVEETERESKTASTEMPKVEDNMVNSQSDQVVEVSTNSEKLKVP